MLRRDLNALRRLVLPAVLLIGLFLLLSTPRFHRTLTPGSRAYVLCAFGFLFAGALTLGLPVLGRRDTHRFWLAARAGNAAALAGALAVWQTGGATPVPAWLLVGLAALLLAACWYPPPGDG